MHVVKGDMPDHVIVNFEIGAEHEKRFDLDLARFLYHSKQGWSGQGHATVNIHENAFSFGMVSDGDRLNERYAGIQAGFERRHVGTDRLQLRFDFSSYHEQWNQATLLEAAPGEIYRTRTHFSPMATVVILEPLEVSFGVDFARYRLSLPVAKTESSNAVVSTLRYHQRWGSAGDQKASTISAPPIRCARARIFSKAIRSSRGIRPRRAIASAAAIRILRWDSWPEPFPGKRPCSSGSCWAMPRPCAAGTSSIWIRWALRTWRTDPSITVIAASWCSTIQEPCGTGRNSASRNSRSAWAAGKAGFQLAVAFPVKTGTVNPVFYAGMNF